jgi:hypothetical protein
MLHRTKSTRYLPVLEASPTRSSSLSSQDALRRKDGKKMSEKELSTKRRATMNSRSAYEEDEMLRQAIEESKAGTLGKRLRDDSEEYASLRTHDDDHSSNAQLSDSYRNKHGSKRQRTFSSSTSTLSKQSRSSSQPPADEPSTRTAANGNAGGKKVRGAAAARNHRDREVRDRQKEIAAQRAEAARKREARSERRLGEGRIDSRPPLPK